MIEVFNKIGEILTNWLIVFDTFTRGMFDKYPAASMLVVLSIFTLAWYAIDLLDADCEDKKD